LTASAEVTGLVGASAGFSGTPTPLRVLCISHSAASRTNGRLRYGPLLGRPDLQLDVVMPERWSERGQWLPPDLPWPEEPWVHVLPVRWPRAGPATWHLHHYRGLDRLIREIRPQVIHLWQEPWSLVAWQVMRLRNRLCPQARLVLEVDQNLLKRLPMPFEQIRRTVLHQTSFVLGRSDDALRVVRACGYNGPSARVGYGVDPAVFRPADRDAARAMLGFSHFTVGYAGRLIEEKGVGDLIEAVGQAAMPLTLAIIGEGPHREALLARAAALGLSDRLRLVPWGAPHEVARFMGGLDVLALLTRTTDRVREQFGRVIIEAQACGTPVIGSDCGAIGDVVGEGGWIVPERTPAVAAALLDRLARHPAEVQAARLAALRQVAERFSFATVADTLSAAWSSAQAAKQCHVQGTL